MKTIICDICGKVGIEYESYRVRKEGGRFSIFHKTIPGGDESKIDICKTCWEKFKDLVIQQKLSIYFNQRTHQW